MQLKEMLSQVGAELAHIPNWPEPQSKLRMLYNMERRRSLGRNARHQKSPSQVLAECIAFLKTNCPNYEFKYDREFFAGIA